MAEGAKVIDTAEFDMAIKEWLVRVSGDRYSPDSEEFRRKAMDIAKKACGESRTSIERYFWFTLLFLTAPLAGENAAWLSEIMWCKEKWTARVTDELRLATLGVSSGRLNVLAELYDSLREKIELGLKELDGTAAEDARNRARAAVSDALSILESDEVPLWQQLVWRDRSIDRFPLNDASTVKYQEWKCFVDNLLGRQRVS